MVYLEEGKLSCIYLFFFIFNFYSDCAYFLLHIILFKPFNCLSDYFFVSSGRSSVLKTMQIKSRFLI